jgi:hypothetical protein
MELRVRNTGEIITEREFRNIHKNTSFPNVLTPQILDDFGLDPILEGPQAQTNPPYEISVRQGIEEINGKWFTKYVVGPVFTDTDEKTAEEQEIEYKSRIDEQAAKSVREQRDRLLNESDWMVIKAKETGTNLSASFKEYRQALRDISLQDGFPHNVNWPENLS